jgi:hypothetical protein
LATDICRPFFAAQFWFNFAAYLLWGLITGFGRLKTTSILTKENYQLPYTENRRPLQKKHIGVHYCRA